MGALEKRAWNRECGSDHLMWNRCSNCCCSSNGVKTGLRAINLKENVFCLRSVFWCASVKITAAEGRKIIVKWYSTCAHRDFIFFIFHLLLPYLNGCIFLRFQNDDDQCEEQCNGKTSYFNHSFAFYGSICIANAYYAVDIHLHPILYGQKLYFVNKYHSLLIGIESKIVCFASLCAKYCPFHVTLVGQ